MENHLTQEGKWRKFVDSEWVRRPKWWACKSGLGPGVALALPIIYGAAEFIFTAIGCVIYNFVAGLVGGIEFELDSGT